MNLTVNQAVAKLPVASDGAIDALYAHYCPAGTATNRTQKETEIADELRNLPDPNDSGLTDAHLGGIAAAAHPAAPAARRSNLMPVIIIGVIAVVAFLLIVFVVRPIWLGILANPPAQTGEMNPAITLKAAVLPGVQSEAMNGKLEGSGGTEPYTFELVECVGCSALKVASDGSLSGTPTIAGDYLLKVKVTDADDQTNTVDAVWQVAEKVAAVTATPSPTPNALGQSLQTAVSPLHTPGTDIVIATATGNGASCTNVTYSANVPFEIQDNMDVGDPKLRSVVYAKDATGADFVAIIEPGYNLDFESVSMTGKYMQTTASINDVLCTATAMSDNRLYVGPGEPPTGFTKQYPGGWKMNTTQYTDTKIETEGATWDTVNIALSDAEHKYGDRTAITICQLWDGSDAKHVYHVIVEPGSTVSSPDLQGTCWMVSGGNAKEIYARATQMAEEVKLRDDNPVIDLIFVGDVTNLPNSWEEGLPSGWSN